MSGSTETPLAVSILDREYMVGCQPEERAALIEAAATVDARLRQLRQGTRTATLERLAVLVALNLAHELASRVETKSSADNQARRELGLARASLEAMLKRLEPDGDQASRSRK